MFNPINLLHIYRDTSIDPGASHTTRGRTSALRHLTVAAETGEVTLPAPVRRAIDLQNAITEQRSMLAINSTGEAGIPTLVREVIDRTVREDTATPAPDDLADQALAAVREQERHTATGTLLSGLATGLEQRIPQLVRDHLDDLLDPLREELQTVLTQAREARAALAGVNPQDANQVATATRAQREAIVALPALATKYNRLRLIQRDALAASAHEPIGTTSHSPRTYGWADVFATGVHELERPTPGNPGPPTDLPSVPRLLAVAARDDAWLPTYEQMETALAKSRAPKPEPSAAEQEAQAERNAAKPKVNDKRHVAVSA